MDFAEYSKLDAVFRQAMDTYAEALQNWGGKDREDGGYALAHKYLNAMKEKAEQDNTFRELAGSYLRGEGKTLLLKDVLWEVQIYMEDKVLNQHNGLAYIDSVSYHYDRERRTCCDIILNVGYRRILWDTESILSKEKTR